MWDGSALPNKTKTPFHRCRRQHRLFHIYKINWKKLVSRRRIFKEGEGDVEEDGEKENEERRAAAMGGETYMYIPNYM